MTRLGARVLLLALLAVPSVIAQGRRDPADSTQREYVVSGMVLQVDRARQTVTVSHLAIAGLMPAMTMAFEVRRAEDLEGLVPGAAVEFMLVVNKTTSYAERIRVVRYQSVEPDPLAASRLKLLDQIVSGGAAVQPIPVGGIVPDFTLTDQERRQLTLSDLRGKVVALNFVYTRCVLPNFCLRIANNFAVLQKRFKERLGRDLFLLTVTFDPVHDTPAVLADYAAQLGADVSHWRFLTGSPGDVRRVCRLFGVAAFPDEGLMNHSLHTAVIDRQGKLVANIEGNEFTAVQLGDLVQAVLR